METSWNKIRIITLSLLKNTIQCNLKNNIDRNKYKFEYEELAMFMNWIPSEEETKQ